MEIVGKHVYKKSVDAMFKSFGDKAGIDSRFTALGHRNIDVTVCKLTKTSLDVAMTREVPVNAPSLLKKFFGEWNTVTQEENWTGTPGKSYEGVIKIALKGVPVTITGKMVLSGDTKGCTNDVTLKIECGIPLIGKKLAEFIGETSAGEMQKEYEYIRDHF